MTILVIKTMPKIPGTLTIDQPGIRLSSQPALFLNPHKNPMNTLLILVHVLQN